MGGGSNRNPLRLRPYRACGTGGACRLINAKIAIPSRGHRLACQIHRVDNTASSDFKKTCTCRALRSISAPPGCKPPPLCARGPFLSAVRCNAYAASDAECCREDTPISSLWNVSRSRLTAGPAVVFVAPRLTLSKPSPRGALAPFRLGWPASSDGSGNSRGGLKWSPHPVETLFYRQPWPGRVWLGQKPGNGRTGDNPDDSRSGQGLLPVQRSQVRRIRVALRFRPGLLYLAEVSRRKPPDRGLPT
jgi:hypothetical protein